MAEARTLAVLIGASEFPSSPALGNGEAFENSAQDFRQYLHDPDGLSLAAADVLDLFDDPRPASTLLDLVIEFLHRRQSKKTSTNVERLLVYYVGHGGFTPVGQEYFLAVRSTRERNEGPSSIRIADLGHVIRDNARTICQYLILDCCFSAQAYNAFQSGPGDAAMTKTLDSVPKRGTALLCSSGPREVSLAPANGSHTMFSEALLTVLKTGDARLRDFLSLADLGSLIEANLRDVHQDERVRPQVHCPNQPEGDLSDLPLFPNRAFQSRPAGRYRPIGWEETTARIPDELVSAMRSSLPSVRLTAIKELVGLFQSTNSPQLAELVRTEMRKLSEVDDSRQVQKSATDALAECATVPPVRGSEAAQPEPGEGEMSEQISLERAQHLLLRKELEIAGRIQQNLNNSSLPEVPFAGIKAVTYACREVGGDFFDCIQTASGVSIVVGDVSGKGVSAAVIASVLQGVLFAELKRDAPLSDAVTLANQFLVERTGAAKYATLMIIRLHGDGALEHMRCGAVPPLVLSGTSVRNLEEGNLPIGLFPAADFQVHHEQLSPGDRVILFTDGLSEAENENGDYFGEEWLTRATAGGFEGVEQALKDFIGPVPLMDDYILAEVTYRGEPENA